MAIELPESASDIISRSRDDVKREVPSSNPWLRNSWLGALIISASNRIFDFYLALSDAVREAVPDTAVAFLERWAAIWGITRIAASRATGTVQVTGEPFLGAIATVPVGAKFTIGGLEYDCTTATSTVLVTGIDITRIDTVAGTTSTVEVTCDADHNLKGNALLAIGAASNAGLTGVNVPIVVTAADKFTYKTVLPGEDTSGDTPTTTAQYATRVASVNLRSVGFGDEQNQLADAELKFQSPIANIVDSAVVETGLIGAIDEELTSDLRLRYLDRLQNPIAHFSAAAIKAEAKTVAGVTRVFVDENDLDTVATVGAVTIYFMRDNDGTPAGTDPIPSGAEVAEVDAVIQALRPANTAESDVSVNAPTEVTIGGEDFTFTALAPDSASMRTAVEANIRAFFADNTEVGVDVPVEAFNAAIFNTVDTSTGLSVTSFTISAPAADITVAAGEIATVGVVDFSGI